MARKLNLAVLATILVAAALLHSVAAQTTHVVGDALAWTIPPGGSASYSNWAASKTFTLGDILVFNFTTGSHDVAEVTKASYDACTSSNSISLQSTGPARITLNRTGAHYFICNFNGHCSAGQKLMINVNGVTTNSPSPSPSRSPRSSPSPSPARAPSPTPRSAPSPTPASAPSPTPRLAPAPAPAPSRPSATYTVGDALGWTVPSNGAAAYQTWTAGKTFNVGDVLVFNFVNGAHNVAEVTKTNHDSCNTASPISLSTNAPTRITLTSSGEHYFICAVPGHCSAGQKLAINVGGTSDTPSPSSPPASDTPFPAGGVSPPPPPGNSADSLGVVGFFTFLSTLVALFY